MAKRRTFGPDFKAQSVLEEIAGLRSAAEICREHRLSPQLFSAWKADFLKRAPELFASPQSRSAEQERIAELERLVGRLTMELEISKKVSTILTSLSTRNGR